MMFLGSEESYGMLLDVLSAQVRLRRCAAGDILTFWFLYSVKREKGVGAARRENAEMSAKDDVLTRRGGQSVCKQSWEYAWAGCSNPGNR